MEQDTFASPPEGTPFDEAWYLNQYPGVADAVRSGEFRSGWHHYVLCGQAEGREAMPPAPPAATPDGLGDKLAMTRLAYKLLLGRDENDAATLRAQASFSDVYELRHRFMNGAEYRENQRLMELARLLYRDEEAIAAATRQFEAWLAQPPEIEQRIARLTETAAQTNAYAHYHARRFGDQLRAAAAVRHKLLARRARVRLLDVGQAPVTTMYPQVVSDADLLTANLAMGTSAEVEMAKYRSLGHYFVNFETEALSDRYPELLAAPFDIIMYCEVIEHIRASPAEQIRDLLRLLAPGGAVIVSTPNAFSHERIQKLATGRKFDSIYSRRDRHLHDDHHIHVREFTVAEMRDAVREAGGEVMLLGVTDYYSEPGGAAVRREYVSARENQTLIITRSGTDGAAIAAS